MHVGIHLDTPIEVEFTPTGKGVGVLTLKFIEHADAVPAEVNIHRQTPESLIALGEAIAAAGRKLDDEQKRAAIRAQLARPHKHTWADHIVAPDEPCDGTCTPEWTAEQILRNEG